MANKLTTLDEAIAYLQWMKRQGYSNETWMFKMISSMVTTDGPTTQNKILLGVAAGIDEWRQKQETALSLLHAQAEARNMLTALAYVGRGRQRQEAELAELLLSMHRMRRASEYGDLYKALSEKATSLHEQLGRPALRSVVPMTDRCLPEGFIEWLDKLKLPHV